MPHLVIDTFQIIAVTHNIGARKTDTFIEIIFQKIIPVVHFYKAVKQGQGFELFLHVHKLCDIADNSAYSYDLSVTVNRIYLFFYGLVVIIWEVFLSLFTGNIPRCWSRSEPMS